MTQRGFAPTAKDVIANFSRGMSLRTSRAECHCELRRSEAIEALFVLNKKFLPVREDFFLQNAENLAVSQQFFYCSDNFVPLAAPVGGDEHVAGAFAAETLDGGFRADDFDHLGNGFAVLLEFQQLEFSGNVVLGHDGSGHNVQRVNFYGG